ncbi:hypothetical protein COLO4_02184 [Corchorus olitorius]|uniref:Uncharacterized protein n=1 Tax=Corchorus olitorius TaxID=93759 RepID=A0A1R3L1E3_9ROSI|nr:hypothetical protein COLO4_02184 [Corchorus olitorius]
MNVLSDYSDIRHSIFYITGNIVVSEKQKFCGEV